MPHICGFQPHRATYMWLTPHICGFQPHRATNMWLTQKKKLKRKPKEKPKRKPKEKLKEEIPWFFTKVESKPYTVYRRNKYNQLVPEPLL